MNLEDIRNGGFFLSQCSSIDIDTKIKCKLIDVDDNNKVVASCNSDDFELEYLSNKMELDPTKLDSNSHNEGANKSLLFLACEQGKVGFLKFLFDNNESVADPDIENSETTANRLFRIDETDSYGRNAMHIACMSNNVSVQLCQMLIEYSTKDGESIEVSKPDLVCTIFWI